MTLAKSRGSEVGGYGIQFLECKLHNLTDIMLKQIQSEAAAGGDNSPFLDDMASNIRPLRRRLRLTKGRLVGRMTQERQKLSFFIVIMFLVIFGLIVLAEVGYQVNIHSSLLNL